MEEFIKNLNKKEMQVMKEDLYMVIADYYKLKRHLDFVLGHTRDYDEIVRKFTNFLGINTILRIDSEKDFIDLQGNVCQVYTISFRKDTREIVLDNMVEFIDQNCNLVFADIKEFEKSLKEIISNEKSV